MRPCAVRALRRRTAGREIDVSACARGVPVASRALAPTVQYNANATVSLHLSVCDSVCVVAIAVPGADCE